MVGARPIHNACTPPKLCEGLSNLPANTTRSKSECRYGAAGGSDTISQQITCAPGCQYIVEYVPPPFLISPILIRTNQNRATIACDYYNSTNYGTPHVVFRVTLDHTIVIPQQLSCPTCSSQDQPGCGTTHIRRIKSCRVLSWVPPVGVGR